MPISKYFHGNGNKVLKNMEKNYGEKKGKQVFYATANKYGETAKDSEDDKKRYHEMLDVVLDAIQLRKLMKDVGMK